MNIYLIKKIYIILIVFLLTPLSIYTEDIVDGPFYTNTEPPQCYISGINGTGQKCAATSCAMLMKYWAIQRVVRTRSCEGYARLFSLFWDTVGSVSVGARCEKIKDALTQIAYRNKIDSNDCDFKAHTIPVDNLRYEFIKKQIKYSLNEKSPWDRPGILVISADSRNSRRRFNRYTFNKHVVLVWGCKKIEETRRRGAKKTIIRFKFKDPARDIHGTFYRFNSFLEIGKIPRSYFVWLVPKLKRCRSENRNLIYKKEKNNRG